MKTKKCLLLCGIICSILISCSRVMAGGDKISDNVDNINLPGNLVINTSSIVHHGINSIEITNNGQSPVIIYSESIVNNQTKDLIDETTSNCSGKILYKNQFCTINLKVALGEAGITSIKVNSDSGTYVFPINVDTTGNGVLDSDINTITTTKEKEVNLVNKGALPVEVKSLFMESHDTTLIIKDVNCLNSTILPGKSCQLKVMVATNQLKSFVLKIITSNQFLRAQRIQFSVVTNISKLGLFNGESTNQVISLNKPGLYTYTVKNIGTSDISINQLNFSITSIGEVLENQCNNKKLQPDDICSVSLNIVKNAYNSGEITATTAEKLESTFIYMLKIVSNNITVEGSDSITMHTNVSETFSIDNSNAFDIDVDSIDYDKSIMMLSSACGATIRAYESCQITIHSLDKERDDGYLYFNEFGGKLIKAISAHISDGMVISNQPKGSYYYSVLPVDTRNFYQIFTIHNNSNSGQEVDINLNMFNNTLQFVYPSTGIKFISPSCVIGEFSHNVSISPNSTCELIIRAQNNVDKLYQLYQYMASGGKVSLDVKVAYSDRETFTKQFKPVVSMHSMHIDATYPKGAKIATDEVVTVNSCNLKNSLATISITNHNLHTGNIDSSDGIYINADLVGRDTVTITNFYAMANGGGCAMETHPWVIENSYLVDTKIMEFFTGTQYGLSIIAGSGCDNERCNVTFSFGHFYGHHQYVEDTRKNINFIKPKPGYDVNIIDDLYWQ